MLVRFNTSNFLSFDDEIEFNMLAASFKNHQHHVHYLEKINLLKFSAIYGANGAGKSNLIKAISCFQDIVKHGSININIEELKFKLDKHNNNLPIKFEIELEVNSKIYAYILHIDKQIILEESLYLSGINKKDKMIFERQLLNDSKTKISFTKEYQKNTKQRILIELFEEKLLKNDELLLSKFHELDIDEIFLVHKSIVEDLIFILPDSTSLSKVVDIKFNKEFKEFANSMIKIFDFGINSIDVESTQLEQYLDNEDLSIKKEIEELFNKNESLIKNKHDYFVYFPKNEQLQIATKEDGVIYVNHIITQHLDNQLKLSNFNIHQESDGTQRILEILPALFLLINQNKTIIIDEIDQSLHTVLLKSVFQKISENKNIKGQLIFVTHDSNLLDLNIFRQDEIWFVEKNIRGSSKIYSLSEFKPRYDLDIKKGYLQGRYGAIPFVESINTLKW